mgnify:CR=1 FL=1
MYVVKHSRQYKKSYKRISQNPNFNVEEVDDIVIQLRSDKPLDSRYYDHELKGEYRGIRECHIKNDLLLLYQKNDNILVLLLVDIGTHASIFGK